MVTRFRQNPDAIGTELPQDQFVLLHPESSRYVQLNRVGHSIWKALAKPASADEVAQELQQSYDVSETQCKAETDRFMDLLLEINLIVPTED